MTVFKGVKRRVSTILRRDGISKKDDREKNIRRKKG